jgi:glycosyltransferase involved in cell wall biosynthesis
VRRRPSSHSQNGRPDVLVVVVDSTPGWSASARALARALVRAGANVQLASTGEVPLVRTYALTDLVQARMARAACLRALALSRPRAIVYCSITAALLWPAPGAIWLDCLAAENRPGRHGVWQRAVERRRLRQAPLVLAMSARALDALRGPRPETVVVPSPVTLPASPPPPLQQRDVAAVTYAGNPQKKRLDFILSQWARARRGDERLVVAGIERLDGLPTGVEVAGRLAPERYRALLRRARVFVCAPTREEYGIAPLEALAEGCQLVTTPAPGAYPALELARSLDPRLVGEELVAPLRAALDRPLVGYAQRAARLLEPFTPAAVSQVLSLHVLPKLVAGLDPP